MFKLPAKIEYVLETLLSSGFEAYIVGGCVRDMLMGKTPQDFDIATNAMPKAVESLFERTVATGIKHGTVTVLIDKTPVEVTTFRTEAGYTDCRHPDNVEFVTDLKDDLSRRDFTVNAMAYNHHSGLIDIYGGKVDLENGLLRAVGEPQKRFCEDALRILRLFRFASVLDFQIEKSTLTAALSLSKGLELISRERISAELKKALCGKKTEALKPLIENGGLEFLGIKKSPDFKVIEKLISKPDLAFFAFLKLSGSNIAGALAALKCSNRLKTYCHILSELLSQTLPCTKPEIKKMLAVSSPEIFEDYIFLNSCFCETKHLEDTLNDVIQNNEPYLIKHLAIDGKMLEDAGVFGKDIGEALKKLQQIVIKHPELNHEKELLNIIRKTS